MASGTWTSQNKVRPGVYIRFKSTGNLDLNVGDRGVVAICEPMSWGPVAQVMTVEAGADTLPYCGYDKTHEKARFISEIFKGTNRTPAPKTMLLFRPTASSAAKATVTAGTLTATAKYPGARGNDLAIVVSALEDAEDTFTVSTIVDGQVADLQVAKMAENLQANDWVDFSGSGALTATTGEALTGGADGTVEAAAYTSFLQAIEPYKFDVLIYDGQDATVQQEMIAFVKRLAEEGGYTQLVASGLTAPDSQYVINVESGVTLSDGTQLSAQQATWWVGGAQAGARYNESLTYAAYPGAVAATPLMTNSQYIAALQAGKLVFFAEDNVVKIEQDINSLVSYTAEMGEAFKKNRVMRLCSTIAGDICEQFSQNYVGVVNNNEEGRTLFKAAIVGYLLDIQGNQGIQNFTADDVQVLAGEDMDAIVVNLSIQPVDSVEKIYLQIEMA